MAFSKQIIGKMNEDGTFKLSSFERYVGALEFVGSVEQKDDGVYLAGDIHPKEIYSAMFHTANVILNILGF